MHSMIDPVAAAARQKRDAAVDARIAALAAERQAALDAAGQKLCLYPGDCGEPIDVDATVCPHCRRPQSLGAGTVAAVMVRVGGDRR